MRIISIFLLFLIASCNGTVQSKWSSCRKTDSDLGCVSISQADNHILNKESVNNPNTLDIPSIKREEEVKDLDNNLVRSPDIVGRLWIAPYLDNSGNYHEGSFVRVIDEKSKWEFRR